MNAMRSASPDRMPVHEVDRVGWISSKVGRWRVPIFTYKCMIVIRRGSELASV